MSAQQFERRYAGGDGAAERAYEADRAQAAGQGWVPIGHKWDAGVLVVLYEQRSAPAPWSGPAQSQAPAVTTGGMESDQLLIGAGIAWIIAAALAGYLALEQLNAGNTLAQLGINNSTYMQDAAFNGIGALVTVYFGARMVMKVDLAMASMIWALITVGFGAYQVANGVSVPEFVLSIVAAGVAGILSFAVWRDVDRR